MIRFSCEQCGTEIKVSDAAAGKTISCSKCRAKLTIPVTSRERSTADPTADPIWEAVPSEAEPRFSVRVGSGPAAKMSTRRDRIREPRFYRAIFNYAMPLRIAAFLAAICWALITILMALLPFFIASDVSNALHPASQETHSTFELPKAERPAKKSEPVVKTPIVMVLIYCVAFVLSFAMDAVFLLGVLTFVDYACLTVDQARNIRKRQVTSATGSDE